MLNMFYSYLQNIKKGNLESNNYNFNISEQFLKFEYKKFENLKIAIF